METQVTSVRMVSDAKLPVGRHSGIWGGYTVHLTINGVQYELRTRDGIRTPAAPCIVTVSEDGVAVETE